MNDKRQDDSNERFSIFGPSVAVELAKATQAAKGTVAGMLGNPPDSPVPAMPSEAITEKAEGKGVSFEGGPGGSIVPDEPVPAADEDAGLTFDRVTSVMLDDSGVKIAAVAQDKTKSADDRMWEIQRIDPRFKGKDSNEWHSLLDVTAAAIRQTSCWIANQEEKKLSN